MKVTAITDDKTIEDVMKYSSSSTPTEAVKIALNEYINSQERKELSQNVKKDPLVFKHSPQDLRSTN